MASKLEQALARLEHAIGQLEQSPAASSAGANTPEHDAAAKAEITAIRGLVHDAMSLIAVQQGDKGGAS